jgi:hypothetical protein
MGLAVSLICVFRTPVGNGLSADMLLFFGQKTRTLLKSGNEDKFWSDLAEQFCLLPPDSE